MKVQNYSSIDSPPTDPLEAIVEAWYQSRGFITASNKWFWVHVDPKRPRGYQDIDVLAVGKKETVLVSVSTNLDDKVRCDLKGRVNRAMLRRLSVHFDRAETFVREVREYRWLVARGRSIARVVAYGTGEKLAETVEKPLAQQGIDLLPLRTVLADLRQFVQKSRKQGLRTNNQVIRLFTLLDRFDNTDEPAS